MSDNTRTILLRRAGASVPVLRDPHALPFRLTLLLGLPFIFLVGFGMAWPLVAVVWDSFSPGLTLENYTAALQDQLVIDSLIRTFRIAFIVTLAALVFGYFLAYSAWNSPGRWGATILLVVSFPVLTSLVTRNYAWIILLGRTGPVNSTLQKIGVIDEPLQLLNTETAVIVGMIHVMLPFAVLPIFNALQRIDRSLVDASLSLGAGRARTLFRILFPLSAPGVMVSGIFVFVLSIGFFITPALLGGPGNMMIANVIDREANFFLNFEGASAIAAILLLITLLIVGLAASRVDLKKVVNG